MATSNRRDCSIEDMNDEPGGVGCNNQTWNHLIKNIPIDVSCSGWFDSETASLCEAVDLSFQKFSTVPRPYDIRPSQVPPQHPLRAIAKVLHLAPVNSTVRIYCNALSDPYALDLILHHGGNRTVKMIMQPCESSVARIKEFLRRFERLHSYDMFNSRIELRIDKHRDTGSHHNSLMHTIRLMTDDHCLYGSYNLTPLSRCANWEVVALTDSFQSEIHNFEARWAALQGRQVEQVYPLFYPEAFTLPKRRRLN